MGKGIIYQKRMISSSFKASIQVQANPSATVIASLNGVDYSAIADATTGIASIEVQKQGTYTLSSDCAAATLCSLNDEQVTVEAANAIVEATYVKLNRGYTTFDVNNTWGSNTLIPYWDGSAPSEYCDGYQVEEVVSDGNTVKYTGFGETYAVNTTTNIVGYKETVTLGTSKTYQLKAYITINGVNYYGGLMTATGTAAKYTVSKTFTASTTYTVPTGIRSITAFVVGGGGSGGNGYRSTKSTSNYNYTYYNGGAGGGGGYQTTKTFACIPSQTISCVIGSSNANSTVTCNGQTITANKGEQGAACTAANKTPNGGSGYRNGGTAKTAGGNSDNGYSGGGGGGGYVAYKDGYFMSQIAGGAGGGGGGGRGSGYYTGGAVAGTANTGGGGGGGGGSKGDWLFGPASGGSGVVIISGS